MHDWKNGTEIGIQWVGGWLAVATGCPADTIWTDEPVQNGGASFCPSNGSQCGAGVMD
jgi:hypothetical protein